MICQTSSFMEADIYKFLEFLNYYNTPTVYVCIYIYIYTYIYICVCVCVCVCVYIYIYMWKRNMKSFSNETLNFFSRKFWASYILDLAKTVLVLRMLWQKSIRNFGIRELWALENSVLVAPVISQRYMKYTLIHSSKLMAYLFHICHFVHKIWRCYSPL